jgi:hypothetical protein
MLETVVPAALESATAKHMALRRGLPRDYLSYMGAAVGEGDSDARRIAFIAQLKEQVATTDTYMHYYYFSYHT